MGMDVSGNNPKINKGKDHYKMYFKWDNIDWNARENEKKSMKQDLDDLKNEMNEIKQLLRGLANGN